MSSPVFFRLPHPAAVQANVWNLTRALKLLQLFFLYAQLQMFVLSFVLNVTPTITQRYYSFLVLYTDTFVLTVVLCSFLSHSAASSSGFQLRGFGLEPSSRQTAKSWHVWEGGAPLAHVIELSRGGSCPICVCSGATSWLLFSAVGGRSLSDN